GRYELFQISIINPMEETEKKYIVNLSFESDLDKDFFEDIVNDLLDELSIFKLDKIIPLENLIEIYIHESSKIISSKIRLSDKEKFKVCFYASLKKLNLDKIFPLLIDDYIEEIFLDSPVDHIYLNHQIYGRCRTN
ncbi:MAG: hypothetical protein ACFFAO_18545, partial [Candidatus Hermodarchaeota archaeon]